MWLHIVMIALLIAVTSANVLYIRWARRGRLTAARSIAVASVGVSAVTFTAMYWFA